MTIENFDEELKNIIDSDESDDETDYVFNKTQVIPKETPIEGELVQQEVEDSSTASTFDKDFEYIRKNMKEIITQGQDVLRDMIAVAKASDAPNAYQTVALLMRALADTNKDLLSAHKHKDERVVQKNETTNVQNNTIFVGSTAEFSKLLKQRREQNDEQK